jgi:methionine-rich copper-binding protein CopC
MKSRVNIVATIAAILPLMAAAHTELKQATPANGSVVKAAPEQIMLMFSEAATLTKLTIQKAGDKGAQKLGPLPKTPAEHFMVAAPKLGPGAYVVSYRALSDDNHVASGTVKFGVSADAKAADMKSATPAKPMDMQHMDMKHTDSKGK